MKVLARVLLIIGVSLVFVGITVVGERAMPSPRNESRERVELRRRAPEPRISRYPQVLWQLVFYLWLAITGRYVLRLRL